MNQEQFEEKEVLEGEVNSKNARRAKFKEVWENIKLLFGLLRDYMTRRYTKVPFKAILAIVGTLIYFFSPIDLIPDVIPIIGFLDDALVVKYALKFLQTDLEEYKKWIKEN